VVLQVGLQITYSNMNNRLTSRWFHWVAGLLCFGIPFALNSHGFWLDITIGGLLKGALTWLTPYATK
jgi:Na+-driven multidrug efflux pump